MFTLMIFVVLLCIITPGMDGNALRLVVRELAETNTVLLVICDGVWANLFFNRK